MQGGHFHMSEVGWCLFERISPLKGHSHAILVLFKNQIYVFTSMNAHK